MGFQFDVASWNVVEGAMFMGWGGNAPGLYTAITAIACLVIIWLGNKFEKTSASRCE